MIAIAKAISHGANAIRYSVDKDKADIVKVNHLPDDITPMSMWARMLALQKQYEAKLSQHRPVKNNAIRIEVSPTAEETEGWTLDDWNRLAEDFIREFDAVDLSASTKCKRAKSTNLKGSQYVATLHRDSRSGILHLHINANRIDMMGNVNDAHDIHVRAMTAAQRINQQRGWTDSKVVSQQNKDEIAEACRAALLKMSAFDWGTYMRLLKAKGYEVMLKRDRQNEVKGYTIKRGNSTYKSSEIGKGRIYMPSKILATWARLHGKTMAKPVRTESKPTRNTQPIITRFVQKPLVKADNEPTPVVMRHFDFSTDEFHHYPVDIPQDALDIIDSHIALDKENVFAKIDDIRKTALLLFANYLDAATTVAAQSGGGGGGQTSGWGRDKDEDERAWAHRCAMMANRLCAPRRKMGRNK